MESIKRIRINKNRGWRGLAELDCENERREDIAKMIFSFSQPVWEDMLKGFIVLQDEDNFILLEFDNTDELPKPTQQRSVLIKSFQATVVNQYEYPKENWRMILSILLGMLYAISDEIHQGFSPGRSPRIADVYIDTLGVILGTLLILLVIKIYDKYMTKMLQNMPKNVI